MATPCNGGPCTSAATRKPTRMGRLGPRAGIPKRTRPKPPTDVLLSNQRGLQQYEKGRGPEDPTVRREGTREPGRRGAICCCGLSRQPPSRRTHPIRRCGVVLPSLVRFGWTVAHASLLVALLDKPVEGNSIKYSATAVFCLSAAYHLGVSRTIPLSPRLWFSMSRSLRLTPLP